MDSLAAQTQPATTQYIALRNRYGQVSIVPSHYAGKRLVEAVWWAGGIHSTGIVAIEPGELAEQAARRTYGHLIPSCYADTLTVRETGLEVLHG